MSETGSFLEQAEVDSQYNHFVIGMFERGVTVVKQQTRALNLIYSLQVENKIPENSQIAIIGGGISGITAAAAALSFGHSVYLFEKNPFLCHLQRGCETRWLHPHIYDWPVSGSELPYARLPLLSWKAGTAANVVDQILTSFEKLVKDKENKSFHRFMNASLTIKKQAIKWLNSSNGNRASGEKRFDIIIFAVGYGIERMVEDSLTFSYWRNDSVNQPVLVKPNAKGKFKFFVSGAGDGGLIDVLRAKIENFNQSRIIYEIFEFDNDDSRIRKTNARLKKELQKIAAKWNLNKKAGIPMSANWLHEKYDSLYEQNLLKSVDERLSQRLRPDTEVTLNAEIDDVTYLFNLDRASLLNTFLIHRLWTKDPSFEFVGGKCQLINESPIKVLINGEERLFDHYIFRHGTDRLKVLEDVNCYEGISKIKKPRVKTSSIDTSERLWSAGYFEAGKVVQEFVPPATVTIATTFVNTLSDIISRNQEFGFRLTLHRLIKIKDKQFFQQIARYSRRNKNSLQLANSEQDRKTVSKKTITKNEEVRRVFRIETGIVGLVCRLGKPIIIKRMNDRSFKSFWEKLQMHDKTYPPREIDKQVKSLLACPFFAPHKENGPKYVSAVLFVDSSDLDFFSKEILEIIYAACQGFVLNLEDMKTNREVFFSSAEYLGYPIHSKPLKRDQQILTNPNYTSLLEFSDRIFQDFKKGLTFRTIQSLDAELIEVQSI
ncbi:MAG: FAD-dependent oxidoreductase [Pyrinomonadaceae bacterium]